MGCTLPSPGTLGLRLDQAGYNSLLSIIQINCQLLFQTLPVHGLAESPCSTSAGGGCRKVANNLPCRFTMPASFPPFQECSPAVAGDSGDHPGSQDGAQLLPFDDQIPRHVLGRIPFRIRTRVVKRIPFRIRVVKQIIRLQIFANSPRIQSY